MTNALDTLIERGFVEQCTHEDELRELLEKEKVTFYIGFDPTADSLHVGHFVTVMAMSHLQKAGHRPIALFGGGTGMIGDPSGKEDMRKLMTKDIVSHNVNCFKKQLSKFIDISEDKALFVDNADWLLNINYVDFLREVGPHFTVNRMLASEAYKIRMDRELGLSFLEFNYMIMQSYDFLQLFRKYNCKLQLGGNDQWSNIISGVDLIRRKDAEQAYGMTFKLLTNSQGVKMGKTVSGALWLDPEKTSPYDFYQYWRNVDDADVKQCLSLLTFLPMDEVNALSSLEGSEINKAKEVLAFEITKLIHDEDEALKAESTAKALFSGKGSLDSVPSSEIEKSKLQELGLIEVLEFAKLIKSRGEGRRLIEQGGVRINDEQIKDISYSIKDDDIVDNSLMIQKGKKVFHKLIIKE